MKRQPLNASKYALLILYVLVISGCGVRSESKLMNWNSVCDKYVDEGYGALTEPEQVWLNTRGFIDSVNNGGLVSFFYNSYAERYDDTVRALRTLKADEAAKVLEWYGGMFGDSVPRDIEERNRIIISWEGETLESIESADVDHVLYALFDTLEEDLDSYVVKHGMNPD